MPTFPHKTGKILLPAFGGRTTGERRLHSRPSKVREPSYGSTRKTINTQASCTCKNREASSINKTFHLPTSLFQGSTHSLINHKASTKVAIRFHLIGIHIPTIPCTLQIAISIQPSKSNVKNSFPNHISHKRFILTDQLSH